MQVICIDVQNLAPPEPMTQIIQALAKLKDQQCLKVVHSRQPFPLYEKLEQNAWLYQTQEITKTLYHIYIFRQNEQQALLSLLTQKRASL